MVSSLILYLKLILPLLKTDSGSHEGQVHQHVNLIKGNPAANPSLKPPEQYLAVSQIAVNHPAASPGSIFFHQSQRYVKMAERHHRLDAVF